jgi:hypothetical protein
MNKILLASALFIITLASCSEDFKVSAPYKDVTVVYGILSMRDSAHYIRIQKAFLDETKSAINMSKVADSNFYASIKVEIKEYESVSGKLLKTIELKRVDLNLEGYPKDPASNDQGFFNDKNYAFKMPASALINNPSFYKYTLHITNFLTGRIDSSDYFSFVNNDSTDADGSKFYTNSNFENSSYSMSFARTTPRLSNIFSINGNFPRNAKMMEGHIIFHYVDVDVNGKQTDRSADYHFADTLRFTSDLSSSYAFSLRVPHADIYGFLLDAIGPAPAGISRYMDSCDIILYAGSNELYQYKVITQGQTGGITGDQIKPNYTNMRGENVLGLIASRAWRKKTRVGINQVTIDSLMNNPTMQPLNIRGRSDH